jgi:membrane protease YdiL (CAAX protease family)
MAILVLMLAVYHAWLKPAGHLASAAGAVSQKVANFGVRNLPAYVALGTFYSIAHSFLEEYYWRWFVFGGLRRLMPWKVAVAVSSVGFMGHHVLVLATYFGWTSIWTALFSVSVAVGGAVWAWIYHRSGSLWGPWLSHVLVDAAIFVVGYDLIVG